MIPSPSSCAPGARSRDSATQWRVGPCEQEGVPGELKAGSAGGGRSPPLNHAPLPLLEATAIEKVYRNGDVAVAALRGVSLDLAAGDFVAIMGASGSGKSSFMNIVGCLDRPTRGAYFLDGEDVGHLSRDALARAR